MAFSVATKRCCATIPVVVLLGLLPLLLLGASVGINYTSSKYGCSFSAPSSDWKGNTEARLALLRDVAVEYINEKNFSHFTFKGQNKTASPRMAVDRLQSRIKSRAKSVWVKREQEYNLGQMLGYKREIGYIDLKGVIYNAILAVFEHKDVQYVFVFYTLEKDYSNGFNAFVKLIKSFRVSGNNH